jgi:hypothetical protein
LAALVPPGVVTVTSTVPEVPAGAVTVIDVLELTVTAVPGFVPKLTVVAPVNPLPVRVTTLVPVTGPELGETPLTVGAGAK